MLWVIYNYSRHILKFLSEIVFKLWSFLKFWMDPKLYSFNNKLDIFFILKAIYIVKMILQIFYDLVLILVK